jgi:hypothetical protein
VSYDLHAGEGRFTVEFQLYDIAALQFAYGRNLSNVTDLYDDFDETILGQYRDSIGPDALQLR